MLIELPNKQRFSVMVYIKLHMEPIKKTPLNKATRKDLPYKKCPIMGDALQAYIKLKDIWCSEPVMTYPRSNRAYALIVDASTGTYEIEGGKGTILTQINKN